MNVPPYALTRAPRGRHWRTGKAGSAVPRIEWRLFYAARAVRDAMDN